ncbi:MBL fold metallo-hydrolase [Mycolicibacillus trivialis]|uniref:MBL fold metallo-hydrolase n=1 Tax=Mycolicibacillus trivialis TaxID=1798 RepID=A0A1X2EMV5_9MYCO|nr:MBL fold metallo-hydrolase [Mycolicibacillus trivialis]ORX06932.1 MBL fold metallo-hydrolase [Mycolicibacillus trivialis]
MARLIQVTETVYLAHGEMVNWALVADHSGVMLIDAGYPGDRDAVVASLRDAGFAPADVRAILLTHAHIDHLGSAIWFTEEYRTPVYCHYDEVGHARREYLEQASPLDVAMRLWQPRWALWSLHLVRAGGLSGAGIPSVQALTPQTAAELPGAPLAVPSPGHTGGHCSYVVDGVLVSGDALVTGHPLLPRSGPQLLPALFSHDHEQGVRSLAALELLDTTLLAPGHGALWEGPIREAVAAARAGLD